MAEEGELVYVIPVGDGSGSWVLMNNQYEEVQTCTMPQPTSPLEVAEEDTQTASKAPAAVGAAGLGLLLLAGLL